MRISYVISKSMISVYKITLVVFKNVFLSFQKPISCGHLNPRVTPLKREKSVCRCGRDPTVIYVFLNIL